MKVRLKKLKEMSHRPKRIFVSEESYIKTKNLPPVFDRYIF